MDDKEKAKKFIRYFKKNFRKEINKKTLNFNRLPDWIKIAKIRYGWVDDTLLCVFEDNQNIDSYKYYKKVNCDTVLLLETQNFNPSQYLMNFKSTGKGIAIIIGEISEGGHVIIHSSPDIKGLNNWHELSNHTSLAIFNISIHINSSKNRNKPIAFRFIPFALYVNRLDVENYISTWNNIKNNLLEVIEKIHNSDMGNFYENLNNRNQTFSMNKESGVIILGKDTEPELQELIQVRDYLRGKRFRAELIKFLPDIPVMSNKEKVCFWAIVSKFCIMIDRKPSGHIAEYEFLKNLNIILALLRPKGKGSTYMIGDDSLIDVNHIKIFEFEKNPLEIIPEVIKWALKISKKRKDIYNSIYPWRNDSY